MNPTGKEYFMNRSRAGPDARAAPATQMQEFATHYFKMQPKSGGSTP
jgi:hypothetical protein